MSGATEEALTGRYFRLTLATPRKAFMTDPATGESGEREFHTEAKARFHALLGRIEKPLTAHIEKLRAQPAWKDVLAFDEKLTPFDEYDAAPAPGPRRVSVMVRWRELASLEICLGQPPTKARLEALHKALDPPFAADLKRDEAP